MSPWDSVDRWRDEDGPSWRELRAMELQGRPLSAREIEVLALTADGMDSGEVGARLHLQPQTVRDHLKRVYAKLGARNAPHAVGVAFRRGILGDIEERRAA